MTIQLKRIREKHKISQNSLAKQLGVSVPYLCRVENGIQPISLAMAISIADFFKVSLDELLGRKIRKED